MCTRFFALLLCAVFVVSGSSCIESKDASPEGSDDPPTPTDTNSATDGFPAPLDDAKEAAIRELWEKGQPGDFESRHKAANRVVNIRYRTFEHPEQKAAIVISSGRTECMFKYDETIYDLYQEGYSVYIHDHRGQGFSDSTTEEGKDAEIGHGPGHVENFGYYVDDLHEFVTSVVQPSQRKLTESDQNLVILGHSMGGCIASLYIEEHTKVFRAAVLCSPMHEPDLGLFPGIAVETIAALQDLKGNDMDYATGGGPYKDATFDDAFDEDPKEDSALTHSEDRYERIRGMSDKDMDTRVGGASFRWVREAIDAAERARENAGDIEIDVLLLQATDDIAVTSEGQEDFRDTLNEKHPNRCKLVPINGGYHELLIELDAPYRKETMAEIRDFLAEHVEE